MAIVGVGSIARAHLEALDRVAGAELTALVEPHAAAAARDVAEARDVPLLATHDDERIADLVDAVVVCTPPAFHRDVGEWFLDQGKHVLCEKPLALSSHDARALAGAARKAGATLMMASKFRYVDDVAEARELLAAGTLGHLVTYSNVFSGKVDMAGRWNADPGLSGGGVIADNGPHAADLARYLLGPVEDVHALAAPPTGDLGVEETARLQFRTGDGVFGLAELTWSVDRRADTFVEVHGTEGVLHVGWRGSRYWREGDDAWTGFGSGYRKLDALAGQLTDFVETVRGRRTPRIGVADAVASVAVVEAAYRSLARHGWEPVAGAHG